MSAASTAKRRRSNSSVPIHIASVPASVTDVYADDNNDSARDARAASNKQDVRSNQLALWQQSFPSPTRASLTHSHPDILRWTMNQSLPKSVVHQVAGKSDNGIVRNSGARINDIFSQTDMTRGNGGSWMNGDRGRGEVGSAQHSNMPFGEGKIDWSPPDLPDLNGSRDHRGAPGKRSGSRLERMGKASIALLESSLERSKPNKSNLQRNQKIGSPSQQHNLQRKGQQVEESSWRLRERGRLSDQVASSIQTTVSLKDLQEKQQIRDELSAQLQRLETDVLLLMKEAKRYENADVQVEQDQENISHFISLLTTNNPSCAPLKPKKKSMLVSSALTYLLPFSSQHFIPEPIPRQDTRRPAENPHALPESADENFFLTLFSTLSLSSTTSTPVFSTSVTQTQSILLSAPPPFPSTRFQVPLTLYTDPTKQSVLSISLGYHTPSHVPPYLHSWIRARLANPLLSRDISGLCWGINRYWAGMLARARMWARLANTVSVLCRLCAGVGRGWRSQSRSLSSSRRSTITAAKTTTSGTMHEVRLAMLLSHLDRSTLSISLPLFNSPHPSQPPGSRMPQAQRMRLLVSCDLTLDSWTGELRFRPDVAVAMVGADGGDANADERTDLDNTRMERIEREVRRVFAGIVRKGGSKGSSDEDDENGMEDKEGVGDPGAQQREERLNIGGSEVWTETGICTDLEGSLATVVRATEGVVGILFS